MKTLIQAVLVSFFATVFISCLGTGEYFTTTVEGDDMPDRTLSIEDFPSGRFGTFEGLDAQTEFQIMKDFFNCPDTFFNRERIFLEELGRDLPPRFTIDQFFDNWRILAYHGTFSGYVVVDFWRSLRQRIMPAVIFAGGGIPQTCNFQTRAWKDGQIYCLAALYNQGKLTREDAQSILRLHPRSGWR